MKKTIFTGAGVAIVTPMNTDGSIDFETFGKLIDFQIENGTDAIVVCGTTGESSTMSDEEHKETIRYCVERVNKRVPVIAGTGSNDTAYAVQLSKEAEILGADAVLVVSPYYNKTSQNGLIKHFTTIADAINIPVMLYNIPGRTGVNIAIDTFVELSKHENIVAVKEAGGNMDYFAKIIEACGDNLDVYSGDDGMTVPVMSIGGKGVISVLSNVMPKETHELCQLCLDNNFAEAGKLQIKYLGLINALFCDVNPIPVKEALALMGICKNTMRLPLCPTSEANIAKISSAMKANGLLK
ncbi:MAG: 4-hydroxy-tetrahydrodipicolinate synthase [Oscillospiraceae bacterium]